MDDDDDDENPWQIISQPPIVREEDPSEWKDSVPLYVLLVIALGPSLYIVLVLVVE